MLPLENQNSDPRRWIVLLSTVPVLAVTQIFWLTFAPITDQAVDFYRVSPLSIAFLSMSYMIIYIIMAIPASWLIDTKGFRLSMGVGAVITAIFGMMRGIYAKDFSIVLVSQLGVALGQPFLTNSITKVAARWFPVNERATAAGIASMAGYLGMIIAMILTPFLTGIVGIQKMLIDYGYGAIACAAIFLIFSKERPQTSSDPSEEAQGFSFGKIKSIALNINFQYLMISIFIVMGIFNAVMTWIEDMLKPRGISSAQAGLIGGIMIIVGIIGAVILPSMSDKLLRRRPFLIWPIIATIPGFIGLTFFSNYTLLLLSSALMGFCIMGMGPVAFQYGAEIAYPIPEGTSYGLLMIMGQISGIVFIYFMDALRSKITGDMTLPLVILVILMIATLLLITRLKESRLIQNVQETSKLPM